jgi:hypothetical protein
MTSTPPSSVCPRRSKLSFHLARQLDRGRNNASNEVRYVPKNSPVVNPTRLDQAFTGLWSQLHAAHRQSLEGVKLWSWHTYEMHSVFYGKSGVTEWYQSNADCRTQPQIEMVDIKDSLSRKAFPAFKVSYLRLKIYIL